MGRPRGVLVGPNRARAAPLAPRVARVPGTHVYFSGDSNLWLWRGERIAAEPEREMAGDRRRGGG